MYINFEKMNGLVPAIVQDADTRKVLMLGFMNEEAYKTTIGTKKVTPILNPLSKARDRTRNLMVPSHIR